jgi:hypothetical protein
LAASGLASAFLPGRLVIFLADTESDQASRGNQHSWNSFVQRAKLCSLGRNKRSSAIQVSAYSKSLADQRIRRKDAHALDSPGTTF